MFSADPFGRLKNIQKCFRQIRSDSRKTCRKPGFSHDPARSHSKRRAGCQSKRRAGSHSERSFFRLFVRSSVRSFVHSFVCSFVRSFVRSFALTPSSAFALTPSSVVRKTWGFAVFSAVRTDLPKTFLKVFQPSERSFQKHF